MGLTSDQSRAVPLIKELTVHQLSAVRITDEPCFVSASSQDYLAHIIDQSDLSIRPEQVCALFGNIEDIYEFNR